jgi:hypothetical protein
MNELIAADFQPSDFDSPVWAKVRDYCRLRIDSLRAQNDGDLSEAETAKLRGRIAELNAVLALPSLMTVEEPGEE